jgi:hypothetical protein
MKYTIMLLLLATSSIAFGQDTTAKKDLTQRLVTVAPSRGGLNVNYMIAPVGDFTIQQMILDENTVLYRTRKVFVRAGLRYQSLYLSGTKSIEVNNFHSISIPLSVTYILSRNTNITGILSAGIASDFRISPTGSDIFYNAGVRLGFRQTKAFKLGVILVYTNTYAGTTLIPLIDFEWKISDRWKLEAVTPVRSSLKYKLDKAQSLAFTQGYNIAYYRLKDSAYLQFQQITTGLMYERIINKHWTFNLITGYAFNQKLQTFKNDQKISFNSLANMKDRVKEASYQKNSFILQGALIFRF